MIHSRFDSFKSSYAGIIVAIFSLLGHLLKFSAIVCFLIWPIEFNHSENCSKIARGASQNACFKNSQNKDNIFSETIYLELLGALSTIGMISSSILIYGIVKRKSGMMVWWMASQGITIIYQIVVSIDFSFCCKFREMPASWAFFAIVSVVSFLIFQIFNMFYIIKLYQDIVDEKTGRSCRSKKHSVFILATITLEDVLHI